ncbi:MAG: helix-turn-helix transcriptional regulator [Lachnospiraceae bacterium]|nr:helix-turn-helix transcriptional regulator [Lachnospiraceae bacterium]
MGNGRQSQTEGTANALSPQEKKKLGIRLKEFREEKHMNQEELAKIAGCTGQYISDVERGKYSLSLKKYMTICDRFGVSADELLFGHQEHYSEYDVRNRIMRKLDGMTVEQIDLLDDQIDLMKKMFKLERK